jgi:hypothetical protein
MCLSVKIVWGEAAIQFIDAMLWYDMIYLTAIDLTLGGSSTVHVYKQTIHRTTQLTQTIHRTTQLTQTIHRTPHLHTNNA